MKLQSIKRGGEQPSRMNYLITNNPTGELIHYLSRVYRIQKRKNKKN
jgi:hypothetical protein